MPLLVKLSGVKAALPAAHSRSGASWPDLSSSSTPRELPLLHKGLCNRKWDQSGPGLPFGPTFCRKTGSSLELLRLILGKCSHLFGRTTGSMVS